MDPDHLALGARPTQAIQLIDIVGEGVIDPRLAGLLTVLVGSRTPILVAAGPRGTGKTTLLEAVLEGLPSAVSLRELTGYAEDFDWLPEAATLGWRPHGFRGISSAARSSGGRGRPLLEPISRPVQSDSTYLLVPEFSDHLPRYTWGEQARVAIRALSLGYGLGGTIQAESLEEVLTQLGGPQVGLTGDELSRLGVVLILRIVRHPATGEPVRRVVAAHYVRPVARDAGGHVRRLDPAVLATWDPAGDRFEDFSWGVTAELAERIGWTVADFSSAVERRIAEFAVMAGHRPGTHVR